MTSPEKTVQLHKNNNKEDLQKEVELKVDKQ
jgi:hypothetical protein